MTKEKLFETVEKFLEEENMSYAPLKIALMEFSRKGENFLFIDFVSETIEELDERSKYMSSLEGEDGEFGENERVISFYSEGHDKGFLIWIP